MSIKVISNQAWLAADVAAVLESQGHSVELAVKKRDHHWRLTYTDEVTVTQVSQLLEGQEPLSPESIDYIAPTEDAHDDDGASYSAVAVPDIELFLSTPAEMAEVKLALESDSQACLDRLQELLRPLRVKIESTTLAPVDKNVLLNSEAPDRVLQLRKRSAKDVA